MRPRLTPSRYSVVVVSLVVSYALLISSIAPFGPQVADAVSAKPGSPDFKTKSAALSRTREAIGASSGVSSVTQTPSRPLSREGEVLVRFRASASEESKSVVAAARGVQRRRLQGESGVEKLSAPPGRSPESLALELMQEPSVEFAEPNFVIAKDDLGPSDPRFGEQWALRNIGQEGGQAGSDINATTAWQTTTGLQSTVIAVIDSGIDFSHPDLINNRWTNPTPETGGDLHGWDFITDIGTIRDEQGHGTAIAGIIAAQGNNSIGLSGVMWQASLMSLRVLDNTGTGDIADAVEAIDYAVEHGAEVINISWGTSGESMFLKGALERAIRRGVVVVCSAGNGGQDIDQTAYYPASFNIRELIAVASTDNFDQLSSWSNRGLEAVTVAAPGTDILTTQMGGGYWTVTGTSASAPLVTGVAGLMKSYRQRTGAAEIRSAITNGSRQVAALAGQVSSGGVVDAGRALEALQGNPYRGHGNGGDNNSNGQGNGSSNVPAGQRQDDSGRRANGREGLRVPVPDAETGAPAPNLPNLDQLRNVSPEQPQARQPIQSNLICADCDPQSGGGGSQYYPNGDPNFSTARELAENETGQAGVDLGSRNFNWSLPLLSLAGRAGLDLNLGLSYNSLVWTKDGSYIKYNADFGTPAPGFRLGLPTLQQRFYNSQTGSYSYLMNTPSGGRVEMRQVSGGVYESADGSYTQLTEGSAQPVDLSAPTAGNYYNIAARHSGKVAGVAAGSQANGANVVQWDWAGGLEQQFQLVPTDSGYYKLVARHSGKVAAVEGQWTTNGARLMQWDWSDGALHEQWRLIPAGTVTVSSADGTQYTFTRVTVNNEYRCTKIKDRNGNYISATYDASNGHLLTITDTLGRVVTFVYNADNNLQSIRQTWAGAAHDWATFSYGQVLVAPDFGDGLLVNGPNNIDVTVLTRVSLHDGSYYTFDYNAAFGQVKQINHFAADAHRLAYTSYNVDSSAGQADCPRFTVRRDWAQYWNGDTDGMAVAVEEALTTYVVAADNSWSKVTAPDLTIYKEFYATTGWEKGLPTSTKNYANAAGETSDAFMKRTTMSWTQDDPGLTYQKNPRPTETNIYDQEGNHRRTTISYYPTTSFSLPSDVYQYAADGTTVLRRTHTDYNLATTYTGRRIIGLPSMEILYNGANSVFSKVEYQYDESGIYFVNQGAPIRQDSTNYGSTFIAGRGNLTSVRRWNADFPTDATKVVESNIGYNNAGLVILTRDALAHQTTISYTDSFSDGVNRNTLGYPTTVTDAEGFQSLMKYNFDHGAITWRQTPSPNTGQTAPTETFTYDSAARILRATNVVNGAFTEWVYPTTMTEVNQFTTIAPGSTTNATLRAFATTLLDGAGRVRFSASELPPTALRYSVQRFIYNNMGRVIKRSNPTETNDSWVAAGDDVYVSPTVGGWRYTQQAYDWKGRPTQTTNTDGTTRVISYGGCGCAGGEVATVQDEHGRQRRLTKDTLGRLAKVEEINWNATVYATTDYTYNVRDQITQSNQAGQLRTFAYDGHGRVKSRTTPEQGTTTYTYNNDDTPSVMTDARGAKATYGYNPRHLPTSISYTAAGGAVATATVNFGYDAAGNRTSMSDGLGSRNYGYDQLSRMTAETRTFNGVAGSFDLSYGYNLVGELTSITNEWGSQAAYAYDKIGRVTGVTGAGLVSAPSYASALAYRAFGATKSMSYGNGKTFAATYDNRLRPTQWKVAGVLGYNYNYDYFNERTGRVSYAQNIASGGGLTNGAADPTLDRSYEYDQVGRLAISHSGAEARAAVGLGQWGPMDGPYSQGYDYDVWGNVTHKYGWGGEVHGGTAGQNSDIYYSYTNNRRNGFSYDAAGNLTNDLGQNFSYDVTGQQTLASYSGYSLAQSYDGEGLRIKKVENGVTTLYLRSSVLGGQVVAEMSSTGVWTRGYVYLGSQVLAVQQQSAVNWMHEDPVTKSKRVTNSAGAVVSIIETDPWGADTARSSNAAFQPRKFTSYDRDQNGTDEAMFRRYNRWQSRFDQPDPYDGSYSLTDPQSFNRYAYVQNDPVNFVDPSGLNLEEPDHRWSAIDGTNPMGFMGPGIHGSNASGWYQPLEEGGFYVTVHYSMTFFFGAGGTLGSTTGLSGGGTPENRKVLFDFTTLNDCTESLFGVTLTSFTPSNRGSNGSFTGYGPDSINNGGNNANITVTNDVNTYSSGQNLAIVNASRVANGAAPFPAGTFIYGYTRSTSPYTNFTSNNVRNPVEIVKTQIHELGNSLRSITGAANNDRARVPDPDAGNRLENCVFKTRR